MVTLKKSTGSQARARLTNPGKGAKRSRYQNSEGTLIEYRTWVFIPDTAPKGTVFVVDEREVELIN